jgi:hypothetical protein
MHSVGWNMRSISMYITNLKDKIIIAVNSYKKYIKIKEILQQGNFQKKFNSYELKEDGIIKYKGKVYVSNSSEMKKIVLKKMHNVPYVRHPVRRQLQL